MEEEKKKYLYGGSYDDAIRDTYSQIQNRPAFSYDLDGDALYQQYKDRYTQNARNAMKDTMGQAAALTGGYGSSYAQGVGQQRYDETMRGLTDMIPTLEQNAYQRWKDQGSALADKYQMLSGMAATEQATAQNAYAQLYALIGATGYQPTPEELAAAGMTQEAADALRNEYLRQTGQLPVGNVVGGSGGYLRGPGDVGDDDDNGKKTVDPSKLTGDDLVWYNAEKAVANGAPTYQVFAYLEEMLSAKDSYQAAVDGMRKRGWSTQVAPNPSWTRN